MPSSNVWILYAVLGALFAAVVQVTSKPAVDRLGGNPVNLIRAVVMVVFFVGVVAVEAFLRSRGSTPDSDATRPATGPVAKLMQDGAGMAVTLALASGVAAGLSWLFGYKALKLSEVSKSYPLDKLSVAFGVILAMVFLGDRPSGINWVGIGLMLGGAYLVTKPA